MRHTSGHLPQRRVRMIHFYNQRFFWLLILAMSSLCVEISFQIGNQTCSAQTHRESDTELKSWSQNTDWETQGQESTLKLRTDLVTVSVSVTDKKNNFVPDLSLQDFE